MHHPDRTASKRRSHRIVEIEGVEYRVIMGKDGLEIRRHGSQTVTRLPWDEIMSPTRVALTKYSGRSRRECFQIDLPAEWTPSAGDHVYINPSVRARPAVLTVLAVLPVIGDSDPIVRLQVKWNDSFKEEEHSLSDLRPVIKRGAQQREKLNLTRKGDNETQHGFSLFRGETEGE